MPKRKRNGPEGNSGQVIQRQKKGILEELTQSKKLLHRALKTAKGFERQKLGKRLTNATKNGQADEIARINREIEVVKTLDLWRATDAHVHKTLLKIKAFAESELLPEEARKVLPKPEGGEGTMVAVHNVTSGIYNTKPVKDTMGRILSAMYTAMGIPEPVKGEKKMKTKEKVEAKAPKAQELEMTEASEQTESTDTKAKSSKDQLRKEVSWDGFGSGESEVDQGEEPEDDEEDDEEGGVSLDEEDLARYDALLGASSDEESFDEAEYLSKQPPKPTTRLSLSLSPEPEHESSPSLASSPSPQPEPQQKPKTKATKAPKSKEAQVKVGGSTFLPTLMGGYWSGSEESASDLEKDAPPPKKNRPGQMARRAIWEKKYGSNASHIKEGKGPVGKGKDDGWDAKRGAKESGRGGSGGFGRGRVSDRATGENAMPLEARGTVKKDRDDVGILHPSWQAAKKAKEAKKVATFQGKKVTFD